MSWVHSAWKYMYLHNLSTYICKNSYLWMYIIQNCQLYCNKFYAFLMMQYIYDMCIGSIRCVVMGFRDLLFLCHEKHGLVKSDLPLLYQSSTIKWSCCIICHLGFVTWIHNPLIIGGLYTIIPCKLNIIMWASDLHMGAEQLAGIYSGKQNWEVSCRFIMVHMNQLVMM